MMATNKPPMKRRGQLGIIAPLLVLFCLPAPLFAFDFSSWDALLKKNTRPAHHRGVGYAGFDYSAVRGSSEFGRLVAALEAVSPDEVRGRDETLAFWINTYNIFAVKLVCDHFPVASIKDAGSVFFPVWAKPAGKVGGKSYSLDDIEQKILRPLNEPAIHFAIVCASVSCPDLRAEAYTASALKEQLKSQTARFLENSGKGMRVDRENKTVYLSMLFDWYEKDFKNTGGVIGFLNSGPGGGRNIPPDYAIQRLPYNWDLNTVR